MLTNDIKWTSASRCQLGQQRSVLQPLGCSIPFPFHRVCSTCSALLLVSVADAVVVVAMVVHILQILLRLIESDLNNGVHYCLHLYPENVIQLGILHTDFYNFNKK